MQACWASFYVFGKHSAADIGMYSIRLCMIIGEECLKFNQVASFFMNEIMLCRVFCFNELNN